MDGIVNTEELEYYIVGVRCTNCNLRRSDYNIKMGTVVGEEQCANCGCQTLTRLEGE